MKNLVCIKHKGYNGNSPPDLSCKVCCIMYVEVMKVKASSALSEISTKSLDGEEEIII